MNPNAILTEALCFAAGRDVANRRMRKAGRKKWNQADYDAACREFKRLLPFVRTNYCLGAARYSLRTRAQK